MSNPATRRKSVTELHTVVSSVHPCKHCQPCIFCKKGNQSKYFHPKTWKDPSLLPCLQEYEPLLKIEPAFVDHAIMTLSVCLEMASYLDGENHKVIQVFVFVLCPDVMI